MGLFRALIALALCGCASVSLAGPVSFADLARHTQFKMVKISPDGTHLAATSVLKNGQTVLSLIDLANQKVVNLAPRQNEDVLDFWWASPKRVLYTEAEHDGGWDMPIPTGELYAAGANGEDPEMLYGYRKTGMQTGTLIKKVTAEYGSATFLSRIDGDPDHVLVEVTNWEASGSAGAFTAVYKMDVRDGRKVKVATAPMREASYLADHHGNVRFAWGEDLDGDAQIYERAANGDWQLQQKMSQERDFPWVFDREDHQAFFMCLGEKQYLAVCSRPAEGGELKQIWSNPTVEPDALAQGFAEDSFIGVRFTEKLPALALFDPHSPDAQALMDLMQQYPGERVSFVSGTDDGSKAIALVEADADPGTFFLYDRASNKFSPLLQRASWIDPTQLARKTPITLEARDGLKLSGYISYPPGQENAKNLPMVVFVHGGPFGIQDEWDYDPYVQAMATHGYAVLQVNFRGSGGYGYNFVKAGFREWGGKMQDDVTDAARWAIAHGIADPRRICIYGGRYGGYAALEGAIREPALYKCAIGYVGVYDLRLMYSRGDIPQNIYGREYLKRVLGTDESVLAQHSPTFQLNNLKANVMLIVGGRDTRVPEVQGKNLHMALLERGIPHEWLYKADEWHGFYDEDNIAELFEKVDAFLDANIGPDAKVSAGPTAGATATSNPH